MNSTNYILIFRKCKKSSENTIRPSCNCFECRARINWRPWPSMPLLLAVMPLKILGYLRPKKGCPFPVWPWCPCGIMCALLRGRNALFPTSCPFFRWTCPRYFSELFIRKQRAVHVDGEILELHGKEMQNKNKNKHKVTKVPTAKLIEIAVANCKKWSQFRDRIDVLCTK